MEGVDFESEELLVSKAVGLTLHGLDFVVHAFQWAGRYWVWQQPFLSQSTDYMIFRLLDDLSSKRNPFVATDKLLSVLSHRFSLNPIAEGVLQKLISAWRAIRIG